MGTLLNLSVLADSIWKSCSGVSSYLGNVNKDSLAKYETNFEGGVSYAQFLKPSRLSKNELEDSYHPFCLDDPRLKQGKHHCVLRLESMQISMVPFVRPEVLKEELNEQFRILHPWAAAK